MELSKAIEVRRSVRHYDASKTVTREQIEELISAAIEAPSWKNSQTARYYCVLSEEMRERFRAECLPEFNAKNCEGAALIVTAFVANRSGFRRDGTPDNECENGWGFYDLGLHNENLLLKAADMGLATLVMGIRDSAAIRQLLSVPETEIIASVIAVGYPAEAPEKPKRKSLEDIAKFF
ncbi:MAG: nitroreductase family protein [Oscillospiraceae bacterium]